MYQILSYESRNILPILCFYYVKLFRNSCSFSLNTKRVKDVSSISDACSSVVHKLHEEISKETIYCLCMVFAKYPLLIDHINSSDHHSDVSLFYTNKLQEHKPFSLLPPCIPSISCDHHWRKENRTWRVQSNDPDLEKEKSMKFNRTVIFNYLTISLLKEVMQCSLITYPALRQPWLSSLLPNRFANTGLCF